MIPKQHPLVKVPALSTRAVLWQRDDAPQFRLQLRPSQAAQLETLLSWLDALQRDRRLDPELLRAGRAQARCLDMICQDLYERRGRR
jgi:hypothetical protein